MILKADCDEICEFVCPSIRNGNNMMGSKGSRSSSLWPEFSTPLTLMIVSLERFVTLVRWGGLVF